MNSFRTPVSLMPSEEKISHSHQIMMLGSCFAENIGERLTEAKFHIDVNPFGILYNPASIQSSLQFLMQTKTFSEADLEFFNEKWFSFYHHSRFSDAKKEVCLSMIKQRIKQSSEFLKKTNFLFITFGTSWVFELKKTRQIVSNCHKLPSTLFNRYSLTVCDITEMYTVLLNELIRINPKLHVIFTVSPIRHLKDGFIQNQLSKSTLILAIHQICDSFNQVSYFPSYEIMMDDLRDYRFYEEDMVHPSKVAIDYIWTYFDTCYFDEETRSLSEALKKIRVAKNHRINNPESEASKAFANEIIKKIKDIQKHYPDLDLNEELDHFSLMV